MQSQLNPYISFKDNADAAMKFYQTIFGGELEQHTFKEYHASEDPTEDAKIMHSVLKAANGMVFMGADTPNSMGYTAGASISMSLSGDNEAELSGYYEKLCDGATNVMPLNQAPWGDKFGMLTDKFGIAWMVNVAGAKK